MKSFPVTFRGRREGIEAHNKANNKLGIMLPAGVGDVMWAMCKLLPLIRQRKACGVEVTMYLPEGEQQRAGALLDMMGVGYEYMPGLSTPWVWSAHDGSERIPLVGLCSTHANCHLEIGNHISEWHPDLPLEYPVLSPVVKPTTIDDYDKPFVLCFPSTRIYMSQRNLTPERWTMSIYDIEGDTGATVRLVGAGKDVDYLEDIAGDSCLEWGEGTDHIIDRPLDYVLAAIRNPMCIGAYGVACGPLIMAVNEGLPVYMFYPPFLENMIGTWERPDAVSQSDFIENMYLMAETGRITRFLLDNKRVGGDK